MPKAMPKELRGEIRDVLERQIEGEPGSRVVLGLSSSGIKRDAVGYLADIGALEFVGKSSFPSMARSSFRLTAYGREYYGKLTAPRWYWFRHNWFPATVAAATILASVGGIIVNVWF